MDADYHIAGSLSNLAVGSVDSRTRWLHFQVLLPQEHTATDTAMRGQPAQGTCPILHEPGLQPCEQDATCCPMQTIEVVPLVGNTIFQIPPQLLAAMSPLVQSLPELLCQQTH